VDQFLPQSQRSGARETRGGAHRLRAPLVGVSQRIVCSLSDAARSGARCRLLVWRESRGSPHAAPPRFCALLTSTSCVCSQVWTQTLTAHSGASASAFRHRGARFCTLLQASKLDRLLRAGVPLQSGVRASLASSTCAASCHAPCGQGAGHANTRQTLAQLRALCGARSRLWLRRSRLRS
jgi:hypothetical protein